jgi:hypothetical protein
MRRAGVAANGSPQAFCGGLIQSPSNTMTGIFAVDSVVRSLVSKYCASPSGMK